MIPPSLLKSLQLPSAWISGLFGPNGDDRRASWSDTGGGVQIRELVKSGPRVKSVVKVREEWSVSVILELLRRIWGSSGAAAASVEDK